MVSRRGFLKFLSGAAATAAVAPSLLLPPPTVLAKPAAPLFVPSQHLDMGVPRHIFTATEMPKARPQIVVAEWAKDAERAIRSMACSIPMLMLQDNFDLVHGGRIKAGAEVLTDRETADRWVRFGVATPGPKAPQDLQLRSAQRMSERKTLKLRAAGGDWDAERLLQVPSFDRTMSLRV